MKPIKLTIEGLNSFETKQELDLQSLTGGVFGIFGKTGSGKSTILDAITLSLYGKVERSKQNIDFINTKCSKATVSFTFSMLGFHSPPIFYYSLLCCICLFLAFDCSTFAQRPKLFLNFRKHLFTYLFF